MRQEVPVVSLGSPDPRHSRRREKVTVQYSNQERLPRLIKGGQRIQTDIVWCWFGGEGIGW